MMFDFNEENFQALSLPEILVNEPLRIEMLHNLGNYLLCISMIHVFGAAVAQFG